MSEFIAQLKDWKESIAERRKIEKEAWEKRKRSFVRVWFRIIVDDLEPEEVTEYLEVEPTRTYKKGDLYKVFKKTRRTRWAYRIETEKRGGVIIALKQMEEIFSSKMEKLIELKQKHNAKYSIDIMVSITNKRIPEVEFSRSIVKFAAALEADIPVSVEIQPKGIFLLIEKMKWKSLLIEVEILGLFQIIRNRKQGK